MAAKLSKRARRKQARAWFARFLFLVNAVLLGVVVGELLSAFAGVTVTSVISSFTRVIELVGEAGADSFGEDV